MADTFVISLNCASPVSYFHLASGSSPIKRLQIKNATSDDIENVTISVSSTPDFLLPAEVTQGVFPARANLRFDGNCSLSPLFLVACDKRTEGEIKVKVLKDGEVLAEASAPVTVLAFNECNLIKPESIATFVRRNADVNRLVNLAHKKLTDWKVTDKGAGYSQNTKNSVRNYFAACYSVLAETGFISEKTDVAAETAIITGFGEILQSKIASPLELCLLLSAMAEAAGFNPVIGKVKGKWYTGCFLSDECFSFQTVDDASVIAKKAAPGVNELSIVGTDGIFSGEAFEKAEKSAILLMRKIDYVDFFVDIRRARILGVKPLPERVKTEGGFDLRESKDYTSTHAPRKIKEYSADIAGESVFSREKQWERRLLELDLRNSLLNFRVSQTAVKVLTASLEDFVEHISRDGSYTLTPRPNVLKDGDEKAITGFDSGSVLKPLAEFIRYEYINKRLHSVFAAKEHAKTLLNLYRKGKTLQEESGTASIYLCAGFMKWRESDDAEFKYAPILLYPVTVSRRGIASPTYGLELDAEEVQVNNTLLEFLYREFNLDMRGLGNVKLGDDASIMAVVARIRKEIVDRKGWEVLDNVYINTLSFTNYLMWHDVRHNIERMKESPLIRSLIGNRIDGATGAAQLNDEGLTSDDAYMGGERLYLPISADSSQYKAIAASLGSSFVLHGPPGTGKSQTITNIIVNNIVRGKRVLFVAQKMAALNVVYKRLKDIGVGDFCLELHSDRTHKTDVLSKIINTLNLGLQSNSIDFETKTKEISDCIDKLRAEVDAMHRRRYLGFSLYEAMLSYLDNADAPDCLRIDNMFYEKLTLTTFNKYLDVLTELALRAKECGDIEKSPFKHIGRFEYSVEWREQAEAVLDVYLMELRHLKQYARELQTLFNMRTISLTGEKLRALYVISNRLVSDQYAVNYFAGAGKIDNAKGIVDSYLEAARRDVALIAAYEKNFGKYPDGITPDEVKYAVSKPAFAVKPIKKALSGIDKANRTEYLEYLLKCAENREILASRRGVLQGLFGTDGVAKTDSEARAVNELYECARVLFADCDYTLFNESCRRLTDGRPHILMEYYMRAYETTGKIKVTFEEHFCYTRKNAREEINSTIDYLTNIQKNIDYIPSWCKYQSIVERSGNEGFDFVLEPLSTGEITAEDVLRSFKKCVYFNFIRSELYLDPVLCQFSGLTLEETMHKFRVLTDEYEKLTRVKLYNTLVGSLPKTDTAGDHNLERVILYRAEKTNMQGTTIRHLFEQIPSILAATCPCMLMSPVSVAQYLDINQDKFDLVVFDEASQVPTCEAVGAIARGKNVIVVGDPEQLPPTTFFRTDYKDEEHYDIEDLESILDDCLAIGMPEKHLLWHYRSNHESLIAFSNSMFYNNTLLTFPSPNELNGKVSFHYVDGVYERGGTKHNKKEADALIKNVIERLKNPAERGRSIGVVTFNTAQQNYIEDRLAAEIHQNCLDDIAFEVDEPLFVKNLENVQGDERDIILFSVGYGPDANGRLSLNFGPINQQGGYKRLNVAVTRARMEMSVYSSITGNMIDLNRTESAGVKAFKAFLEYAERGTETLTIDAKNSQPTVRGIAQHVAMDLKDRGLICESNLGVSDFKIDVAVVDPRDKDKYILAIIIDSENTAKIGAVKDRMTMQTKILKKLGWNTYNLWSINYFNNPKREINKIKELIATLTEKKVVSKKTVREAIARYKTNYKSYYIKPSMKSGPDYVMNFVNEEAILQKIRAVIETESPIEGGYLLEKLATGYNIPKTAKKAMAQMATYINEYAGFKQEVGGRIFYVDRPVESFRPIDERYPRDLSKVHPDEIVAAAKCAIEMSVNIDKEDLIKEVIKLFNVSKRTKATAEWVATAIAGAISKGDIIVTPEGYCKI